MKNHNPLVTINILSWNRKKELKDTLKRVFKINYPNFEVIVVDNASTDGSATMVEHFFPKVKLIKMPKNIGIGGWNWGFANANGKYIIVLDDDSYLKSNAIKLMVEHFERMSDNVGIIAFKIKDINGNILTKDWPKQMITFWGCGAGIKKELVNLIGGYDSKFFLYMNEKEFSIRALSKNFKTIYCEDIIAYHKSSFVHRTSLRAFFYTNKNNIFTFWKYYGWLTCLDYFLGICFMTLIKSILHYSICDFYKIWHEAFEMIRQDKRERIVDKDKLRFLNNKKWKNFLPLRITGLLSEITSYNKKRKVKKYESNC